MSVLAFAAPVLTALSVAANLYEQNKARKEAKKEAEKKRRQEAFNNVLRVMGGGMPQDFSQSEIPQVNWGGALANIGGILGETANAQTQQANAAAKEAEDLRRWTEEMGLKREQALRSAEDMQFKQRQAERTAANQEASLSENRRQFDVGQQNEQNAAMNRDMLERMKVQMKGGKGAGGVTPYQAIQTLMDFEEAAQDSYKIDPITGDKILVPGKPYTQMPDEALFAIEDALGMPADYRAKATEQGPARVRKPRTSTSKDPFGLGGF